VESNRDESVLTENGESCRGASGRIPSCRSDVSVTRSIAAEAHVFLFAFFRVEGDSG
jgi:hypothetical protein